MVAACASEGSGQQAAFEGTLLRTQTALAAAGDADSLAAAAELTDWSRTNESRRFALLTRAATLAPDRADLVWLEIEACRRINTCDSTPFVATLHRLDPDNGAAWASLLDAASERGDAVAINRYLGAIADSKRFDIYWNASIAHLTAAVLKVGTMDASTALTTLIGTEAALALPPYKNISQACKAPATEDARRLNSCRSIATVMRSGDTYLTEMMGIAIAKQVWPESSAEFMDAVAARRLAEYRMRSVTSPHTNAEALEYLKLLTTHRAEQEAGLAVITGGG